MKKSIMMSMAALLLAGCSTMQGGNATVTVKASRDVQLTNVKVTEKNGRIEATGTLRPRFSTAREAGHVDITFVAEDGRVNKRKVEPFIRTFFRKSTRNPTFYISTRQEGGEVAKIQLIHHAVAFEECPARLN